MKTKLFILLTMLLYCLCVPAQDEQIIEQESHFFDRKDFIAISGETKVILSEKQSIKPPQSPYREGNAIDDLLGLINYVSSVINTEFPTANEQEVQLLKNVVIDFTYSDKGEIVFYQIRFPLEVLEEIPNLEQHLYNIVETIKKDSFTKYRIISPGPGGIGTAAFYLRLKNKRI